MDCNKEEAVRAVGLAIKKMQESDFLSARKIGQRAQQLFPELENIAQLMSVCDVHCSALKKLNGSEADWYGVLQVSQTADETTIKKQYRKLALLLHPDKNKFAGAEAAFKLIGEANRLLTDRAKRSVYDMKIRVSVRAPAPRPPQPQVFRPGPPPNMQHGPSAANFRPNIQNSLLTFWTCCPFCKMRYQYYRDIVNRALRCQTCARSFVAYDLAAQATPAAFVFNQTTASQQKNVPKADHPKQDVSKPSTGNTVKKPPPFQGTSDVKGTSISQPDIHKSSQPDIRRSSAHDRGETRNVDTQNLNNGAVKPDKSPKKTEKKSRKKVVVEESVSYGDSSSEEEIGLFENESKPAEDIFDSTCDGNVRRSFRKKERVSYSENLSDEDYLAIPRKRLRKQGLDASNDGSHGSKTSKGEAPNCSTHEDKNEDEVKEEEDNKDSDTQPDPIVFDAHDSEFHDFDNTKADEYFAVDQVWAVFDNVDCMPRYYARIRKVFSSKFKLKITWLEPNPDRQDEIYWVNQELPVACGKYKSGETLETTDKLMFSHMAQTLHPKARSYFIYPKKGEVWALFKDWDMSWSDKPGNYKRFKFDIVEVVSDITDSGILVLYLDKVMGFVSVFQERLEGIVSFYIPMRHKYKFSHCIPSFRLNGTEREGVPKDSFELDPASLPDDMVGQGHDRDRKSDDGGSPS